MAAFKAKHMKIRILCERAEKEEIERENLEAQGLSEQQIDETIKMRKTQNFAITEKTLPFEEKEKVIKTLHATNLGLTETHRIKSSTKTMMEEAERKFAKAKLKKTQPPPKKSAELERQSSIKKERKANISQGALNQMIKAQNFRDHINEMGQGMEAMSKIKASHYGENFVFTNEMQQECDTQNFDHHLRKNDLKWFSEAYVKYKGTMRK